MMLKESIRSVAWNITLITVGSFLFAVGIKGIVIHHNFITGGLFGTSLLIFYTTSLLDPNLWFLLFNVPLFVAGYILVSKRFFLYSLYSVITLIIAIQVLNINFHIQNQFYAAVAAGVICGAGVGIVLRSLGSGGGLDIIAVILHNRFNVSFGRFYFSYNLVLFTFCMIFMNIDLCIASLILLFISSMAVDYVLSALSQRKVVRIISDHTKKIAEDILTRLNKGATFIKARGAYSGADKEILMTIINNFQLKRLEDIVFSHDPDALFIVENTFSVIGQTFSRRKVY
jgi:uncharacterized membrane-anchored protein YitT (DUF2179 family)